MESLQDLRQAVAGLLAIEMISLTVISGWNRGREAVMLVVGKVRV